jgi:peptidoglycan L-alanyl-D-glutamate endopeptidase CwlK
MSYRLGKRSLKRLIGVHPELAFAVHEAIKETKIDFGVTEGVRSMARQRKLVKQGRSKTYKSYHLNGLAVDLVPYIDGNYRWDNSKAFKEINRAMKVVIEKYGLTDIHNGYDLWGWDKPHYQLMKIDGKSARSVYDIRKIDPAKFPG